MKQAYDCLLAKNRHQAQYIEKVSQELRLPVTNLILYLKLLKDGRPEKKELYIYVMEEQMAQLSELVIAMVAFSESDKLSNSETNWIGGMAKVSSSKKRMERLAIM